MKRILAILLVISLLPFALFPANAEAYSGQCGNDLYWEADKAENTLRIYGSGDMYDYSPENPAPWSGITNLYKCHIENGVTGIGSYALNGMDNLGSIFVADTVNRMGAYALGDERGTVYFYGSVPTRMDEAALAGRLGSLVYFYGWSEADLQTYASHMNHRKETPTLQPETKCFYQLGEQILPEDFVLYAYPDNFTPGIAQIGYYDNSTAGAKRVQVTVCGLTFTHSYYVLDGDNYLSDIRVQTIDPQIYTGAGLYPKPEVKLGEITLKENLHYTLSYANNTEVGMGAEVTITGIGVLDGYTATQEFMILRRDISTTKSGEISLPKEGFVGMPVMPEPKLFAGGRYLTAGTDTDAVYENHVNVGTGNIRIIGKGNYYGSAAKDFQIAMSSAMQTHTLVGNYLGQADGELGNQAYYTEKIVTPGPFVAQVDATVGNYSKKHIAYYELYRLDGEELTLLTTYESEYGYNYNTQFTYDFTDVYEGSVDKGGEVYMLYYNWVNSDYGVYAGAMALIVPAKVPDGTSMGIDVVPDVNDFRRTYFYAYSQDGNLGNITWSISDPAVAAIDGCVVTAKKPGTVTVTGSYGQLSASYELTIPGQQLQEGGYIFYNPDTDAVQVIYQGMPLIPDTDYTYIRVKGENQVTVTVTGCGLFSGTLSQSFDTLPPVAEPTTATFNGIGRAKALLLSDMTYMRATVAFVDGNGNNAAISKADILKNGRILFWKEADLPAIGAATIANATMVQKVKDAGIYTDGIQEYSANSFGIAATEYADPIYFRTYLVVNGIEYYGELNQYSVTTYADNQFRKSDTKLKNLLASMLSYGAAAQLQFGYHTSRLADAGLQKWVDLGQLSQEALAPTWDGTLLDIPAAPSASATALLPQNGAQRTAASLSLQGLVQPRVTFAYNLADGKGAQLPEGGEVTVYYWSLEDYRDLVEAGIPLCGDNATYERSGTEIQQVYSTRYGYEYVAHLEGIAPKHLGNALYVAAEFSLPDGTTACSGVSVYSPEVYANNQLGNANATAQLKKLLQWMVIYGENAKDYFGA